VSVFEIVWEEFRSKKHTNFLWFGKENSQKSKKNQILKMFDVDVVYLTTIDPMNLQSGLLAMCNTSTH
jgi:hypothetical protein